MKVMRYIGIAVLGILLLTLSTCGGGGSSTEPYLPEPGSTDPAEIVLGVHYAVSNLSASQSSTIYAKVVDHNGDKVADGTLVRFKVTSEDDAAGFRFQNSETTFDTTTQNGIASAILSHVGPLTVPQLVRVHVSTPGYVEVYRTADIFFYSDLAGSFRLILTPEKTALQGDGVDHTRIRARIVNAAGVPFAGAQITFTADPPFGRFDPESTPSPLSASNLKTQSLTAVVTTDQYGEASINYVAGQTNKSIAITVTATAKLVFFVKDLPLGQQQVQMTVSDILSLNINAQEPGHITVQVDPSRISASVTGQPGVAGDNDAQVLIRAFDVNGNPMMDGTVVRLEAVNKAFPDRHLGLLPAFAVLGKVTIPTTSEEVSGAALVQFLSEGEPGIAEIRASIGDVTGSAEVEIFDAHPLTIELVSSAESTPSAYQWPITECNATTRTYRVSGGLADLGQGSYVWEITNESTFINVDTDPADTSTATLVYDGSSIYYLDAGEVTTVNMVITVTDTATGKVARFSVAVVVSGLDDCTGGGSGGASTLSLTSTPSNARLVVGQAAQVNFSASGGAPPYTWSFDRGSVTLSDITFVSSVDQAVLVYNGATTTTPGVMIVTVTDTLGDKASALVVLADETTGGLVGTLEVSPGTVDVGSEAIVRFTLKDSEGNPVSGQSVLFEFLNQTPVTDTEFVAPSTGTSLTTTTDANGVAIGVLKAGETTATMNLLVQATAGPVIVTTTFTVQLGGGLSATLQTTPETVDVGGEVVAQFTLKDSEGNPATGQNVLFEIVNQTPQSDTEFVAPSSGTSITVTTDQNGVAMAVIQAGDTTDTTNVVIQASVGSVSVTDVFTVTRGKGKVVFTVDRSPNVQIPGDQPPISLTYVMTITVTTDDGNGNPIANRSLEISTLPDFTSASITSTDPDVLTSVLSVTTDDDGETEFVLRITIDNVSVGANETVVVGNMVLSGDITAQAGSPTITGTAAIIFKVTGTS